MIQWKSLGAGILIGMIIWIAVTRILPNKDEIVQTPIIQTHTDTIYVKGKDSIIFRQRTLKIEIPAQFKANCDSCIIPVDTTIIEDGNIIQIASMDIVHKPLEVFTSFREKTVYRVDTLKITDSVFIRTSIELSWYETRTFGFITGVVATAGIVYLTKGD